MTINEIAKANAKAGRHYFSAQTLRFFGQGLSDFAVLEADDRVFVFCGIHRNWDGGNLSSFAEFHPDTGYMGLKPRHPDGSLRMWTLEEAKVYVDSLGGDSE